MVFYLKLAKSTSTWSKARICQKLSEDSSFLYQFKCIVIVMKHNSKTLKGNFSCKMTCICIFRDMHNIMHESFKEIHLWKSIYWFSASLTSRIGMIWAWSSKELYWDAIKHRSLWAEFTELHKKVNVGLSVFSVYTSSTRFQICQWKVLQRTIIISYGILATWNIIT